MWREGGDRRASETHLEDALMIADRLRGTDAEHSFPGGQASITISVGLSSYKAEDTQHAMAQLADKALYRAKSEGGNRVFA